MPAAVVRLLPRSRGGERRCAARDPAGQLPARRRADPHPHRATGRSSTPRCATPSSRSRSTTSIRSRTAGGACASPASLAEITDEAELATRRRAPAAALGAERRRSRDRGVDRSSSAGVASRGPDDAAPGTLRRLDRARATRPRCRARRRRAPTVQCRRAAPRACACWRARGRRSVCSSGGPDAVVGDAQAIAAGPSGDLDEHRARGGVTRDVRQRLAQRREEVVGDASGDLGVDRTVEDDLRLETERPRGFARDLEDLAAQRSDARRESPRRRRSPSGCAGRSVSSSSTAASTRRRASSSRISRVAPCNESPVANSRWITVSCRSRAMRS